MGLLKHKLQTGSTGKRAVIFLFKNYFSLFLVENSLKKSLQKQNTATLVATQPKLPTPRSALFHAPPAVYQKQSATIVAIKQRQQIGQNNLFLFIFIQLDANPSLGTQLAVVFSTKQKNFNRQKQRLKTNPTTKMKSKTYRQITITDSRTYWRQQNINDCRIEDWQKRKNLDSKKHLVH
ncbi:hypothetical protein SAMN02745165_02006 [Malonomonas rubra DSM 5091]|uniref:Uncharacterized protein n=1 Tax=Malonomonas rubra DSM 5091 TaxID=1122189 RepID=A0A1M6I4D4_MALRU|nr:hypothetical protein [Malonomonas rubra]SHJ29289.1 hypothetical protein SAMN02745165_02006 [Malonomonas rubra DSM 5091]